MRMSCWQRTAPGDRCNMLYASSIVTYGRATGVVVATGMDTQVGNIADLLDNQDELDTPIKRKLNAVGKPSRSSANCLCPDLPSRCPVPPAFDSTVPGGHLSGHLHHP